MKESVNQQPELKKRQLTPKQKKLSNISLGETGETLACQYLLQKKFQILGKNIRIKNNEVDIIAFDSKYTELVFIEVKTRSNTVFGNPDTWVDFQKLHSMQKVAHAYLKNLKQKKAKYCNLDYRFDIMSIFYLKGDLKKINPQIEHFESVTWP